MKLEPYLKEKNIDPKLAELILFFGGSAKKIKDEFLKNQGISTTQNSYGETQMELDKVADKILIMGLMENSLVKYIATEEQENILHMTNYKSPFGVVIDPLDGSSLIGVNFTVGTIVGIYPGDVLSEGRNMLAALYILYGSLTTLNIAIGHGNGVQEFVMDERGEFHLTVGDLKISDGKIYAPGALRSDYLPEHKTFIESLERDKYKLRFSGSFVADVHQILHKGGIFTYPAYNGHPDGKLRLLFEANPMGRIIVEAGGAISNGKEDILSIKPTSVNQRTPIYIGGKTEIARIEALNN